MADKYTGSVLGVAWYVLTPLLMLTVYTLFFSVVMQARWGTGGGDEVYALLLFSGLLLHGFIAEILVAAPALIVGNANYVKKVVFPLEVLCVVQVLSAATALMINVILLLAFAAFTGTFPSVIGLAAVFIIVPFLIVGLGLSLFLAGLGVYFRDVTQLTSLLAMILLFASPIFYPVSILPEQYQVFLDINPLTFVIEQLRDVLLRSIEPNWVGVFWYCLVAGVMAKLGFLWMQKIKIGFADAL